MIKLILLAIFLMKCSSNKTTTAAVDTPYEHHVGSFLIIQYVNRLHTTFDSFEECTKYEMRLITTHYFIDFLNHTKLIRQFLLFNTFHIMTHDEQFIEGHFEKDYNSLLIRATESTSHICDIVCVSTTNYGIVYARMHIMCLIMVISSILLMSFSIMFSIVALDNFKKTLSLSSSSYV